MTPNDLRARVLHRDRLMLIIDKPAGLPVHAGPKGGPNLEQYLDALRFDLPRPPGLAHRLDRDTSGCLILGRDERALRRLGRLFTAGRVEKVYWAVVIGAPPEPEGRVDLPLAKRSTAKRGWWMTTDPEGRPAVTDYRLLGRNETLSWLELRPRTGRTHQIRVHCAEALGCPVLGDAIYGRRPDDDAAMPSRPPLHLHARAVAVPLYPGRPPVTAAAPVPAHLLAALRACGFNPSSDRPGRVGAAADGDLAS